LVSQTKSPVVQVSNYYPFGLQTSDSYTRIDTKENPYLFNAGSKLNEHTGNYEMFFREYDPVLGRMTAVDPMAGKYRGVTPYNYAFNDPVAFNDPSGAEPQANADAQIEMAEFLAFVDRMDEMFDNWVDGHTPYVDRSWQAQGDSYLVNSPNDYSGLKAAENRGAYNYHGAKINQQTGRFEYYRSNVESAEAGLDYIEETGSLMKTHLGEVLRGYGFGKAIEKQRKDEIHRKILSHLGYKGTINLPGNAKTADILIETNNITADKGGFIDGFNVFNYLQNHAKNTGVEVAVFEFKQGRYFVLPWNENTKSTSVIGTRAGRYFNDFIFGDVTALYHTHPMSTSPSRADKALSDKYNIPIFTFGANGNSYMYFSGSIRPVDLKYFLNNFN
jgi:RHS repeat-associated protein